MALYTKHGASTIEYLFSSPHGDVVADAPDLAAFIPFSLSEVKGTDRSSRDGLTYARYFEILKTYLSHDSYHALMNAYAEKTGTRISSGDIQTIRIRSEKHGDFYHISSVDVIAKPGMCRFALTTAISGRGKSCLDNDFSWISHLNSKHSLPYLPRMFSKSQMSFPVFKDPEHSVSFVLGDWLEGYHEFHLAIDPAQHKQSLILWDTEKGYRYLSAQETLVLWQKTAKILTLYYDINTFEEICAWHHAAGDFVARETDNGLDVKLITVRCYAPMIGFSQIEEGNRMAALLHFFAHLSLRMRLDRIDGIGEPAWAGVPCLHALIQGFSEALDMKQKTGDLPSSEIRDFFDLFKAFGETDWLEILAAVVTTYPQADVDLPLIETNLADHARELCSAIQDHAPSAPFSCA